MSTADNGTVRYRIDQAEKELARLDERIDKLDGKLNTILISVIGLALSIAGSAVVFAFTILSTGHS